MLLRIQRPATGLVDESNLKRNLYTMQYVNRRAALSLSPLQLIIAELALFLILDSIELFLFGLPRIRKVKNDNVRQADNFVHRETCVHRDKPDSFT
jgi:hypothetical protein